MAKTKKIKVKKKPPVILVLLLTICIIPCAILGAVLFQSLEDSSKPVVGSRYEGALDPAITEDQLTQIKTTLEGFSGVESVEVNLKTARLAVLINTNDDVNRDGIKNIIQQAYTKLNEILPVGTYFTNRTLFDEVKNETTTVKMYDLQIDAYNVVEGDNQIHYVVSKTGAQKTENLQLVSSPKDSNVANDVMNQNKGE